MLWKSGDYSSQRGTRGKVMSQDHQCHNDPNRHPGPVLSSAPPDSRVFPFKIHDCNTSKVKRLKTKTERNNAKFKSHTEVFKKKTFPRGALPKNNMMGETIPPKDMCNLKEVFITESRLTHHQGIFSRKIKSVNIERLVDQATEVILSKSGPAESIRKTPQSQRSLSLGLIPTPEVKNQDVRSPQKEPSPEIPVHIPEPASCNQQNEEMETCQPRRQSNDRANPVSGTTLSPCRNQPTPVPETAKSIVNMLTRQSLFPGRNLINETRQAIYEKLRRLRDTNPTPSVGPVQGKPENNQADNVHLDKVRRWNCVGKGGTDVRKMFPNTQGARWPTQTPPIRFLPRPRHSPAHTRIRMVTPEDHLKLQDILHQPIHYGSACNPPHQYWQISSRTPLSVPNVNSSSQDSQMKRPDKNTSSFCRIRKARKMFSSPLNARSPEVRWRLVDDPLTDSPNTRDVPSHNNERILPPWVTNQECVSRRSLEDISSEPLNPSRVRMTQRLSSDVYLGGRDQRSPTTKIFDVSPSTSRLSYREQSQTNSFGSPHNVFLQRSAGTGAHGSGVFSSDSFGVLGRETKRHVSPWQDGDIGQNLGRFSMNTMPQQRQSQCYNLCNPPSLPRKEPRNSEKDGDMERIHSKDWPLGRSCAEHCSQQRNMSEASSSQSVQQESFSFPFGRGKPSGKGLVSPKTWMYPRMKLY